MSCSSCNGEGVEYYDSEGCKVLDPRDYDGHESKDFDEEICSTCDGSGDSL